MEGGINPSRPDQLLNFKLRDPVDSISRHRKCAISARRGQYCKNPDDVADSLLVHPDVRRMLLTQRAYAEACRAFGVYVGNQLDRATHLKDHKSKRISELLTPVVKAFFTDKGFECAVMGQQVLGGHGYIKDWGLEQIVRDARIGEQCSCLCGRCKCGGSASC